MARKPSTTLDFISIDTIDKTTLKRLYRKFGKDGRLFWFELLRLLGRTENYILDFSDEEIAEDYFEGELMVDFNLGNKILDQLSNWGNIDINLWKANKIVWCQSLIDRHNEVWRKRKFTPKKPTIDNGEIKIESIKNQLYKQDYDSKINNHEYLKYRSEVFTRDGNKCVCCGTTKNLTIDHIIPLSKKGSNEINNLQTLCCRCNSIKSDKIIQLPELRRIILNNGDVNKIESAKSTQSKVKESKGNNTSSYRGENEFLKDWKKAREELLGKPTNIKKLNTEESINFNQLKNEFKIDEFRKAMIGLFEQKQMYISNQLRPSHFLRDRNIEKYLDCSINNTQLFEDKKIVRL